MYQPLKFLLDGDYKDFGVSVSSLGVILGITGAVCVLCLTDSSHASTAIKANAVFFLLNGLGRIVAPLQMYQEYQGEMSSPATVTLIRNNGLAFWEAVSSWRHLCGV